MDVALFVDDSDVSGRVIAWGVGQIFIDEGLIVTPESEHKGRWHWHLDHDFAKLVWSTCFVLLIEDPHIVAMHWLGDRAWQGREDLAPLSLVDQVSSDWPSCLGLPPRVVDQNVWEVLIHPKNSVWVTSLTNQQEAMQRTGVVLSYPIPFIVFLLDHSNTSRSHVQTVDFILLHTIPDNAWIRSHWLSFEEDALSSPDQRPINDKAVADHPANVTGRKVDGTFLNIEDMSHAEIQSDYRSSGLPCDSFRLASGAGSVEDVQRVSC